MGQRRIVLTEYSYTGFRYYNTLADMWQFYSGFYCLKRYACEEIGRNRKRLEVRRLKKVVGISTGIVGVLCIIIGGIMKEKEIVKLIRSLDESERDAIYQIMKSIIGNEKAE